MPDGAQTMAAAWPNSLQAQRAAFDRSPAGLLAFDANLAIAAVNDRFRDLIGCDHRRPAACHDVQALIVRGHRLDEPCARLLLDTCRAAIEITNGVDPVILCPPARDPALSLAIKPIDRGLWLASLDELDGHGETAAGALMGPMRDPLTGLGNRQLFADRVSASLSIDGAAACAILLIDLDHFKTVNDTLGHPAGDALLCLVADRLRGMLPDRDLVARLGGDEFAVLLREPAERGALALLGRTLVTLLGRPYLIDGQLVNIGASIGIADISQNQSQDGDSYQTLLRHADLALYHAKAAGRNTLSFFEPAMDRRASERRVLELDLRHALDLEEFEIHYQPQVTLAGSRLAGFEALARWRHPVRGLVAPGDFIPLAEEIGQIGTLGTWMLRNACRCAGGWPADLYVAVNVSPYQFADPACLIQTVADALRESGLPGRRLELEITESALLRNEAAVLETLHHLRSLGVRVAMDDFGTGYSSLRQLQSFPFDTIKIDRSFLCEPGDSHTQDAVISAIARLGECLGMSTIAEGIETEAQLARVRDNGCKAVQGFLISRPVPASDLPALIRSLSRAPNRWQGQGRCPWPTLGAEPPDPQP